MGGDADTQIEMWHLLGSTAVALASRLRSNEERVRPPADAAERAGATRRPEATAARWEKGKERPTEAGPESREVTLLGGATRSRIEALVPQRAGTKRLTPRSFTGAAKRGPHRRD